MIKAETLSKLTNYKLYKNLIKKKKGKIKQQQKTLRIDDIK